MNCVIPYKNNGGLELKYCLRGIEKFIEDPQIILIGTKPDWVHNVEHIPFPDEKDLRFKERNIFLKLLKWCERCHAEPVEALFFNDDHFLLQPFDKSTYHFSGKLSNQKKEYVGNEYEITIQNTINLIGDADNYFRHAPIFIQNEILEKIKLLDWNQPWGYCVKSLYCHYAGIKGTEYPDLKIRYQMSQSQIEILTHERPYFSTGNHCVNKDMISFLENIYPYKSKFEK